MSKPMTQSTIDRQLLNGWQTRGEVGC